MRLVLSAICRALFAAGQLRMSLITTCPAHTSKSTATLAVAMCAVVFSQGVRASGEAVPELERWPADSVVTHGQGTIRADVDDCQIGIRLAAGEIFASSAGSGEVVFYKPYRRFSVQSAPYLYKPDVERYSDITWSYKKPRPNNEPWFGTKCAVAEPPDMSEPYFSMNCPAKHNESGWELEENYRTAVPVSSFELIQGDGWTGFIVASPRFGDARIRDFTFCLVGKSNILMGQSSLLVSAHRDFDVVRRAIRSKRFLGGRQ